jgi:hypothetical protein
LTLKVVSGSTLTNADIVACPTTSPWQAPTGGGPGPYDKAPSYSCANPVKATVGPSQMSWQLPTSIQYLSGIYDIVLVPNPTSKTVFTAAFNPPDSSSVATTPGGQLASGTSGPQPTGLAPTDLSGNPVNVPTLQTPSLAMPLAGPAAAPSIAQPPGSAGTYSLLPPSRLAKPASHTSSDQHQQEMAVALLLAIMIGWWYVGGQSARNPQLLGALAGRTGLIVAPAARTGGIGRFARPRTIAPRRLR